MGMSLPELASGSSSITARWDRRGGWWGGSGTRGRVGLPCYTIGLAVSTKEFPVREGIHPKYHAVEVRCACGATWKTRSTKNELHLEICSNCHPFFTGRQKLIDTEGRVERFTKKFGVQTSESRKQAAKAAKTSRKPVVTR
jgi:large subunit ribosomal protein L31